MNKKNMWIIISVIIFLLFLDKCTLVNITTSSIFKNPKYNDYPDLGEGVKSESAEIVKLSDDPNSTIAYDTINNFFLVNLEGILIKLDRNGKEKTRLDLSGLTVWISTCYVFSDSAIYDLSKENVKEEKFLKIINADYSLSFESWYKLFEDYYSKAQIVVYDFYHTDQYGGGQIYLKINEDWTLLYVNRDVQTKNVYDESKNRILPLDETSGSYSTIEGYPEKVNNMILLKDEVRKTYSNRGTTTDNELMPNYTAVLKDNFEYPDYRKKTLFFQKESIAGKISYTSIPIYWSGTAYFRLEKDKQVFNFKGYATKFVFSWSVDPNFCWFHLPEKFKQKSAVSFLSFKFPSSEDEANKSKGLYVVRAKQ
jgi:hypothetical protein